MSSEISYTPSFVAFLDILGFSALIDRASESDKAVTTIMNLTEALEHAKEKIESGWSWEEDKLSVRMFSDCVYVSVPARIKNFDAFFQVLALV